MLKIAAVLLSGVLLFCSFPPFEYSSLAWIALVPLVCLCFCSEPGRAGTYGFLAGVVFWLGSIFWLTRVTVIGWILISLYCACYCALFASVVSWWHGRMRLSAEWRGKNRLNDLALLLGVPAIWVALEYTRACFMTGFPWNLIGVSQYSFRSLIQCADLGGVYLVSYLVVLANTAGALLLLRSAGGGLKNPARTAATLSVFIVIIILALGYGKWRLASIPAESEKISVAAVQPNIPQEIKWTEAAVDDIYRRLKQATAAAASVKDAPDLIAWPETALPDFVRYDEASRDLVAKSLGYGIPLLLGSMDYESCYGRTNYYNSSFLFIPGNKEPQVYAKRHLVLFGEYVPLGRYFPFLRSIADLEEDFTPGNQYVVFRMNGAARAFSVLICFEDTLPYLARGCVKAGARLLINQTNDAWFDPYWASRQHMAHCVFRCVENRVACLRATNSGLTCLIDSAGKIKARIEPLGHGSRAPQILRTDACFSPGDMPLTFYTRRGDIFAIACLAFSLPVLLGGLLNYYNKARQHRY